MAKLKVGIVSAAWGVSAHLPAWRTLEDVEVVGICTSRRETAEAAAAAHDIERAYWDVGAMAADLDIIDIGTRPVLRQDMVMAALAQGKHVYAGIPFSADVPHAEAMFAAQQSRGVTGVVDAYVQALPAMMLLKEKLSEGVLGSLHSVRCRFDLSLFSTRWIGVPAYAWFAEAANGASALRNLGSHALHAMVSLFGPVVEVVGMAEICLPTWPAADGSIIKAETDDTVMALLRFGSGLMGELYVGWSAVDGQGFTLEVQGAEGRMVMSAPPLFPEAFTASLSFSEPGAPRQATRRLLEIPERLKTVAGSSAMADEPRAAVFPMARLFRGLVDAARSGGEAEPSFRQALHVQRVIEAINQSVRERAYVSVADVKPN